MMLGHNRKMSGAECLADMLEGYGVTHVFHVPAVLRAFGTDKEEAIARATPAELRREDFPAGSMGPKVEAVCRFVELTGGVAAIGALTDAELILAGRAGTVVTPRGTYRVE